MTAVISRHAGSRCVLLTGVLLLATTILVGEVGWSRLPRGDRC